jgi:hypothetical protein
MYNSTRGTAAKDGLPYTGGRQTVRAVVLIPVVQSTGRTEPRHGTQHVLGALVVRQSVQAEADELVQHGVTLRAEGQCGAVRPVRVKLGPVGRLYEVGVGASVSHESEVEGWTPLELYVS